MTFLVQGGRRLRMAKERVYQFLQEQRVQGLLDGNQEGFNRRRAYFVQHLTCIATGVMGVLIWIYRTTDWDQS